MLSFLDHIFKNGLLGQAVGYSAVNTARSALSTFISIEGVPVGQHHIVKQFMKGVFNIRPSLPRYATTGTWDLNVILDFLYTLSPVNELSLKMLTYKLTMLLCVLSGQRSQSVHLFDVINMQLSYSRVEFVIPDCTKTSRPGFHNGVFEYQAYAPNRRLCVVTVLKEYLKRTLDVRGKTHSLLLTHAKPHGAASADTIRRWVKDCLKLGGIDTSIFKPHSTRGASTSHACNMNVSLDLIMKSAGWQKENTFTKYYKFKVKKNFGNEILVHSSQA